jgi:3-phenylpropionate/trans-cinnamate dioxygenase ferredoxin component
MSKWIEVCSVGDVEREDVIPFEHDGRQYAIYCAPDGQHYATDGLCTHEETLLADGLVMGHIIECPKHNGRFDYRTGEGKGAPIRVPLRTYAVRVTDLTVSIDID